MTVGILYQFFQSDFIGGSYQGCINSCALALSSGLGANLFGTTTWSFLQNGDLIGFLLSLGLTFISSGSFLTAVLSAIGATIALVFALGIGISTVVAGYTISPVTVKLAQSFAVGLFIWSGVVLIFGAWTDFLGFGVGVLINFILEGMYVYGLYWRGSSEF